MFKEMLRFMYAGKVNKIGDITQDLLIAVNKYSFDELKIVCEKTLVRNVSCENALHYLKLADLYNVPNLKEKAIDFIVPNVGIVLDLPEFKSMGKWQSDVVYELFRALALTKTCRPMER